MKYLPINVTLTAIIIVNIWGVCTMFYHMGYQDAQADMLSIQHNTNKDADTSGNGGRGNG